MKIRNCQIWYTYMYYAYSGIIFLNAQIFFLFVRKKDKDLSRKMIFFVTMSRSKSYLNPKGLNLHTCLSFWGTNFCKIKAITVKFHHAVKNDRFVFYFKTCHRALLDFYRNSWKGWVPCNLLFSYNFSEQHYMMQTYLALDQTSEYIIG